MRECVCVCDLTHSTILVEDHVVKDSKLKNETHVQQGLECLVCRHVCLFDP